MSQQRDHVNQDGLLVIVLTPTHCRVVAAPDNPKPKLRTMIQT